MDTIVLSQQICGNSYTGLFEFRRHSHTYLLLPWSFFTSPWFTALENNSNSACDSHRLWRHLRQWGHESVGLKKQVKSRQSTPAGHQRLMDLGVAEDLTARDRADHEFYRYRKGPWPRSISGEGRRTTSIQCLGCTCSGFCSTRLTRSPRFL